VPFACGTPTVLASFNRANGDEPVDGLILSGSTLYGTAQAGGANDDGVVFSLPLSGGSVTVLASFNGSPNGGDSPLASLILSSGDMYGTTEYGGAGPAVGHGVVFSLPVTGGSPTILESFNGSNGEYPGAGLIMDSSGDLFGTTSDGGTYYDGTVFELQLPEPTSTALLAFGSLALLRRIRHPMPPTEPGCL
jgi:uncharacterized repeat protein (TIGR03803 family)